MLVVVFFPLSGTDGWLAALADGAYVCESCLLEIAALRGRLSCLELLSFLTLTLADLVSKMLIGSRPEESRGAPRVLYVSERKCLEVVNIGKARDARRVYDSLVPAALVNDLWSCESTIRRS
jgi:hypothetical protein